MPDANAEMTADVQAKQALRMRRFLMAVTAYVACAIIAQAYAWFGYLAAWVPSSWALAAALVNGGFFLMLRSGRNLRLRDPSMTELQLHVAMIAAMALVSQTHDARGAALLFVPVPLLFGVLRLNFPQMARVGLVGIGGYLTVIAIEAAVQPKSVAVTLEVLNLISLAAVMILTCVMCGYISGIRAELTRAVRTIREIAERDALTGLRNRRNFDERLDLEIARCQRQLSPGFTLCIIDLDQFKDINDRFGHPVGDQALIAVRNCLRDALREVDYAARYGGDEFVALLEGSSIESALLASERVRLEVERIDDPALQQARLTVSIGVANYLPGDTSATLIARADGALYRAKAEGRNRVVLAP